MNTIKKERWIPSGMVEFKPELGDYPKDMFACYVNLGEKTAIFYTGKQGKYTWYNRFSSDELLKNKIKKTISDLMTRVEYMEKRKEERKELVKSLDMSKVEVGSIYRSSYGYNCTKNTFVKVMGFEGKNKVRCVKLGKSQYSGDWMNGEVMPIVDGGGNETLILKVYPRFDNEIGLKQIGEGRYSDNYSKWNGQPCWENCD